MRNKILAGILVFGIVLVGGWWIWNSGLPGTLVDVRYCEKDSDCVTCCGFNYNLTYGRGLCINKAYLEDCQNGGIRDINVCCHCEYVGVCNTCKCVDNQCVTEKTSIIGC